jgi:hypothetical protein
MGLRISRVRWLIAIISGLLVGANAGVQLWHQLDLELPWDSTKPPVIEQVQPKANVEMNQP